MTWNYRKLCWSWGRQYPLVLLSTQLVISLQKAIRLVKPYLPLANLCWLLLITFLSSILIEMATRMRCSITFPEADSSVAHWFCPFWRAGWHLLSSSPQSPDYHTFYRWLWAALPWFTSSLSTHGSYWGQIQVQLWISWSSLWKTLLFSILNPIFSHFLHSILTWFLLWHWKLLTDQLTEYDKNDPGSILDFPSICLICDSSVLGIFKVWFIPFEKKKLF